MLKSHNLQDLELDFFTSFLDQAIKGNVEYTNLVSPIILDAASYVKGEKQSFELERKGLNIKILLIQKAQDLLSHVNSGNLGQKFPEILDVINTNRHLSFA
mgnify:CR=1 FL=1